MYCNDDDEEEHTEIDNIHDDDMTIANNAAMYSSQSSAPNYARIYNVLKSLYESSAAFAAQIGSCTPLGLCKRYYQHVMS